MGGLTPLRALEVRSRGLSLAAQMQECVELLQAPAVIEHDVRESIERIMVGPKSDVPFRLIADAESKREGNFYASREISVLGDGGSFTCLGTGIEFLDDAALSDGLGDADAASPGSGMSGASENDEESVNPVGPDLAVGVAPERRPIDYVAVTCEARPVPVMGFVQSAEDESAYPLLLRAFSTMIEIARTPRLQSLDREVYKGLLGAAPLFDLAVVLWDDDREDDPRRPLCQLGRDLAESFKTQLVASTRFPPILNDVLCLRMNPARPDFRLRSVWRI